jgi:signal transduction histidine kinase
MSIRLRLTLLYSVILALTLVGFSAALYFAQSQVTFDAITTTLERQAQALANSERRMPRRPEGQPPAPPSSSSSLMNLPGRWTQTRNPEGVVLGRSADLGDTSLPLSDAGLRAVQSEQSWVETAQVQDEPLLIYSQPVMIQGRLMQIVQVAASIEERAQSLATLRMILIVGSTLVILAAFAVGWILAGAALRPIHRITHTAQAIGAERNFSHRVQHVGPNDEVGQLAITFNTMLSELESAYRQVEQALQAQRRFVADASHELRTPLTTVRGNIELLRHEPPIDARERADVLADTKDEVERLIRLVNQLLVLARVDAGRPLRRAPLPIKPLLEDVCRQGKLLAPKRTILAGQGPDVSVLGDRDSLKQVLLILLDNALVHTPPSATVSITAAIIDHQVKISIRDTGPGIPANLLPHIFERFWRGDASRTGGGTGLGLSIARELVQAQEGTLQVTSQIGRGSVFTVTLPQANGEPEDAPSSSPSN